MLSGSPGDYDAAARASIKTILAAESDVSTNAVSLTLIAGSVLVNADIYFGTQAGATYAASALSTGVLADATTLQATLNARFAADGLGITTTVQELRSAPQAVVQGPSPPPPPPPEPPPLVYSPSISSYGDSSTSLSSSSEGGGGAAIAAAGAGGAVVVILLIIGVVCKMRKGKRSSPSAVVAPEPLAKKESITSTAPTPMVSAVSGRSRSDASLSLSNQASFSAKAKMSKAQELLKSWEVDTADLTLGDQLGEGGQAIVVRGVWCGIIVAIKQPKKPKELSQKQIKMGQSSNSVMDSFNQAVRREVRALSRVRHFNVVRLYGACFEPFPMVLMAFAPSGTLQDALDDNKFQATAEIVRLLAGIARGMEAVHAHNLIHLDMKPENVLIGPEDVPWITDFGLSTSANMTSMSQSSAGGRGTLPFKGPELFVHPPVLSKAADVYAYAILAWIVVTGEQPYTSMQSAATSLPEAVKQGERPTLDDGEDWKDRTTGPIAKVIETCWHGKHEERPTFGGGNESIVAKLEKLESSTVKSSDEAGQLSMVTRLIASQNGVDEADTYLAVIDDATGDTTTTTAEAKELAEEREGAAMSKSVAQVNVDRAREQIGKAAGGDEILQGVLAMLADLNSSMRDLKEGVVDKVCAALVQPAHPITALPPTDFGLTPASS